MNLSREAVAKFIEQKYGKDAAAGFLKWSASGDWDKQVKQYTADYKAFKASGKSLKDLKKADIYAYLLKVAGKGPADYFDKYVTPENLKELPKMGKQAFEKHGKFIKQFMSQGMKVG